MRNVRPRIASCPPATRTQQAISGRTFHGTVVDRVMRAYLDTDEIQRGSMPGMVEAILEAEEVKARETEDGIVRWKNASDKKEMVQWCKDLVTRLEPILERLVIPYDYQTALRFRVPLTIPYLTGEPVRIDLTGETDLLVRDAERKWEVWDLKATVDNNYWRKTYGQLIFYDLAVKIMFGDHPERVGLIQPMCKERVLPFTITREERSVMLSRIVRMATDIWQKDFRPKESSSGCQYCGVLHACPKYQAAGAGARVPVTWFGQAAEIPAAVIDQEVKV